MEDLPILVGDAEMLAADVLLFCLSINNVFQTPFLQKENCTAMQMILHKDNQFSETDFVGSQAFQPTPQDWDPEAYLQGTLRPGSFMILATTLQRSTRAATDKREKRFV